MGKCEMGEQIGADGKCESCGARQDQNCGKWVSKAGKVMDAIKDGTHMLVPKEPEIFRLQAAHDGPLMAEEDMDAKTLEWLIEMYKAMVCAELPSSETPETRTDSGVKSKEPQNPDINHVSSTGGDLDTE